MTPEAIATNIFNRIFNKALDTISEESTYLFYYRSNITGLRNNVKELNSLESSVKEKLAAASWALKDPNAIATGWKEKIGEIEKEGNEVLEKAKNVDSGCFKGRLNLKQRYQLGRKAAELTASIKELKLETPQEVAQEARPDSMLPTPATENSDILKSRMAVMEEVMGYLKNDEDNIIGICGMAGVGKQWLAKKIRNRAFSEGLVNEAPMIVVSEKTLDEIQCELAGELKLEFTGTSTDSKARQLYKRLTNGNKFLIIFDKVLKPLELEKIGLPMDGGRRGLDVLFLSETEHSHTPKKIQKNVKLNILPRDEAWTLLKMMAGEHLETEELKSIAEDVLNECGDLPFAIETLGKTLANEGVHAWRNARSKLQNSVANTFSDIYLQAYEPIRLSYKLLGRRQPHAQRLLMLCCLFPRDANIPVEKLIRYAKGLSELSGNDETLEETTDTVQSLVDELKKCSLLLPGDREITVKMHTVVRNVCLSFASDDKYDYMVTHHPELREWPHKRDDKKLHNAISLTLTSDNDQKQLHFSADGLDYPKLELLQLQFRCDSVHIPNDSFHGMKQLRVLDCKQISRWGKFLQIGNALPTMSGYLLNMRTLSLEFCDVSCGDLSRIGNLKRLEILSFFSSKLEELPSEIIELSNLKLLDLRCADGPKKIPSGVLSGLKKLEDLYVGNYDSWPDDSEQNEPKTRPSITELSSLSTLKTLQVRVKYPELLQQLNDFCFEKLERYQIAGIRQQIIFQEYGIGKSLTFDGADWRFLSDSKISSLLKRCEYLTLKSTSFKNLFRECTNLKTLDLSWCDGPEYIIGEMEPADSLKKLKHMSVGYMDDLKKICDGQLPAGSLVELETMKLDSLSQLTHLWSGPIEQPCLGNLRAIEISDCEAITNFFPISVAKCLVQLQRLDIQRCEMLEGIVSSEGVAAEKIVFPKLSFLSLDSLPNFQSFYHDSCTKDSNVSAVHEHELEPKSERATPGMRGCFCFSRKQHAKPYSVSDVAKPQVVTDSEEDDGTIRVFNQLVELPNMNKLLVRCIKSLKHIVDGKARGESFSKLRVMHVHECENLVNLATSDSVRFLQSLEQIDVQNCNMLEAVFDLEGFMVEDPTSLLLSKLQSVTLCNLESFKHLWRMAPQGVQGFRNLQSLEISNCCSLTYVFSISTAKMLENLRQLQVKGCAMVEEIIKIEASWCESTDTIRFPRLADLQLDNLNSLTSFSSGNLDFEFPKLQKVLIKQCPAMKAFCWGHFEAPTLDLVKSETLVELETVKLDSLPMMTHLWRAHFQLPCLGYIRVITISNCEAIKGIFPIYVAKCLVQLQELGVSKCGLLERIVFSEGVTAGKVVFPKLSSMVLEELPNFRSFFSDSTIEGFTSTTMDETWPVRPSIESDGANQLAIADREEGHGCTIQNMFNQLVELPSMNKLVVRSVNSVKRIMDGETRRKSLLKMRVVHVDECQNLMNLAGPDSIRFLRSLEQVDLRNCKSLEVVFDLEGFKVEDQTADSMLLSKLDTVSLHNLQSFKHLWRAAPQGAQGFKHLKSLEISNCQNLTYVLSVSVAKMLENLRQLYVKDSDIVEEVILNEGGHHMSTGTIRFAQLHDLKLDNLRSLRSFSSTKHKFEFPKLREVLIGQCPRMKTFCWGRVEAPMLRLVQNGDAEGQGVWKDNLNKTTRYLHDRFRNGQIESSGGSSSFWTRRKPWLEAGQTESSDGRSAFWAGKKLSFDQEEMKPNGGSLSSLTREKRLLYALALSPILLLILMKMNRNLPGSYA